MCVLMCVGALCSAGQGRMAAVALCRVPGRLLGVLRLPSTLQDGKRSHSGPRKPRISEEQHTTNLTLLPTSSLSLPLPSLSVLSKKPGFSLSPKALSPHIPVYQSLLVQTGLVVVLPGPA